MNEAEVKFLTYVRELQDKRKEGSHPFVHINQKLIETEFFKYPEYNRKDSLDRLVRQKHLKIWESKTGTRYYTNYKP